MRFNPHPALLPGDAYRYFQRLDREQKAAEAERQYQAWLAETYKDVEVPAFLRRPHPKHRIDTWV